MTSENAHIRASEAAEFIIAQTSARPTVGIILGSGLGEACSSLSISTAIPYSSIPGFTVPSATGHSGNLLITEIAGMQTVILQGRIHYYEGLPMDRVTFPVRVLHALGIDTMVLTCAAGGITEGLQPGSIMAVTDHINLIGTNPLIGVPHTIDGRERFVDMVDAYDPMLVEEAIKAGEAQGITIHTGVLAAMSGPCYETPAEVKMLWALGVDAVSMSTVPEVIMARYLGLRVMALALITNKAAGLSVSHPEHGEVLSEAGRHGGEMMGVIASVIKNI